MPDTTQRNSKECCIWTCSHVHAGKAMTISENNGKCRWYLQSKNRQIRWQKDKELSGGVFLKKRKTIFTSHERSRSHATNTISTWNFLMVESGKNIFQSYFLETWRSKLIPWGYWYFLSNKGGRVFRHPRSGKAEVVTHGNLYVNKQATCDFKISTPVTVSLLWTVR